MNAWQAWERIESGPADAARRVLLLPGGMCAAGQYRQLMAEPALAGIRLIAVTLPGNSGAAAPADVSMENFAVLASQCAADLGCDVVAGFSMGASVALEMAASRAFAGPVVLLAPSFSRADEAKFLGVFDRLSRVLGNLPFAAMIKTLGVALRFMPLPGEVRTALAADVRRNDPQAVRRTIRGYFEYLDRHGSVAGRLRDAGVPAWVVHGQRGDGGITDAERATLTSNSQIRIITIPGASYFTPNEEPALVAGLIIDALASSRAGAPADEQGDR
ncbi:MAG TPA: alpha/beta hydrolase [Streptosporangiaceae bacterium]